MAGMSKGTSTRRTASNLEAPRSAAASSKLGPIETSLAMTMMAGQEMFQTTRPRTSAQVPELDPGVELAEHREEGDAEDELRDDEREDHHEVERGRGPRTPPVDADRERDARAAP